MRAKSFAKTFGKRYWNENRWRCLEKYSYAKRALERTLHHIETTFHLIYAPLYLTNLVFKFNAVLVGFSFFFWCQPQCTYLPFDYHLIYHWSWSLSSASALFIRNNKILMRLGVLFLKVFSFKMLCSYFFMKNAYLVTAKITLDVKNCLCTA